MLKTRYNKFLCVVCMALLLMCALVSFDVPTYVYADTKTYSDVLHDLQKADNFSASQYPAKSGDYSLNVIQVAESEDDELFIYVYQPSGQTKTLTASSINISRTIYDEIKPRNYKLQLLNSNGVFFKYLVKDFEVSKEPTRYYSIISIYRPFDASLGDLEPSYDNSISETVFEVAKQYEFSKLNGEDYCYVKDIETIVVTSKLVGFVRYEDGFKLHYGACDSHFIAFSTDRRIDELLEADVDYTYQSYTFLDSNKTGSSKTFGSKEPGYAELKSTYHVAHDGGGWFSDIYSWDRIETVEQFIAENSSYKNVYSGAVLSVSTGTLLNDDTKKALEDKQWVLRFVETDYSFSSSGSGEYASFTTHGTIVGDATILRLKFKTDGITYNLGVVDNKQSGSALNPSGGSHTDIGASDNLKEAFDWFNSFLLSVQDFFKGFFDKVVHSKVFWIVIGVIAFVLLVIFAVVFKSFGHAILTVLKAIGKGIAYFFKGLWWLICLPVKGIKALIEKIKERKG